MTEGPNKIETQSGIRNPVSGIPNPQSHKRNILEAGLPVEEDGKVMIMVHGRGADARSILELKSHLHLDGFALLAPQATNHTWYPYSFMEPAKHNEPWLSSAIATVHGLIDEVMEKGIPSEHIYLLGFSQGACLTLESAARKAQRYGGVIAFTGGLIGSTLDKTNYTGDFAHTPIFLASGDPDPHVPVQRVKDSAKILQDMGAHVTEIIYPGIPHTIIKEEIDWVNVNLLGHS